MILLVVLAGTVAAVTAGVPGTIREWFTREWTALSGEAMPQEQLSLIQELTQPVGISDTNSGVTVTLDSVTVGQNMLWVLLKVSGTYEAEEAWLYHFADAEMDLDLESSGASAPGIWSMDYAYQGLAEDGTLTMLARFCVDSGMGSLQEGGQVTLRLNDLMCSDTVALRGEWTIPFRLEPVEDQESLTLEELTVPAVDLDTGEQGMTCASAPRSFVLSAQLRTNGGESCSRPWCWRTAPRCAAPAEPAVSWMRPTPSGAVSFTGSCLWIWSG